MRVVIESFVVLAVVCGGVAFSSRAQGGATPLPSGGLTGLAGRVEALDGRLSVDSPEGGPTIVRAEIPAAAQEPR